MERIRSIMEAMRVFCLHGFLGLGSDWNPFVESLKQESVEQDVFFDSPNLLSPKSRFNPTFCFDDWCEKFIKYVEQFEESKKVIMGYSMGGRLALHAVMKYPQLFNAAIFFSTNPMLYTEEEKNLRREQDQEWAIKFKNLEWSVLMAEWNNQLIFSQEQQAPQRCEQNYDRRFLSMALENWTVANHNISLEMLKKITTPSYWLCGSFDDKFIAIHEMMKSNGVPAKYDVVPEKGHRIGFSHNTWLAKKILNFLESTSSVG